MKKIYFIPLWISQIYEFVISFAWIIPLCFSVQRLILTLDPILYFRMFECERRFLISFDYWIQIDVNGNKMENRKRKIHCIRIKLCGTTIFRQIATSRIILQIPLLSFVIKDPYFTISWFTREKNFVCVCLIQDVKLSISYLDSLNAFDCNFIPIECTVLEI